MTMMKKLMLPLAVALAQAAFLPLAGAQTQTSDVDPAQGKARATPRTTKSERAEARGERRADGGQAARGPQIQEGQSEPTATNKVPRAERRAATAKRRQANRDAMQRGELSRGGNADAPEKQRKP